MTYFQFCALPRCKKAQQCQIETDAKKSELVFQAVKGIKNNFRAF